MVSSVQSQEQIWPGNYNPSRHDFEVANEPPEPKFLLDFKKSVLAGQDALGKKDLMLMDVDDVVSSSPTVLIRRFIYIGK